MNIPTSSLEEVLIGEGDSLEEVTTFSITQIIHALNPLNPSSINLTFPIPKL